MKTNQSILPINNQYSRIDIEILKNLRDYQPRNMDKSSIQEIIKYTRKLNLSKENMILGSKKMIQEIKEPQKKSSYYGQVDMLSYVPQKETVVSEGQTNLLYKLFRLCTPLDIELAQNKNTLYEFNSKTFNSQILHKDVNKILEYSFFEMSSVISTPNIQVSPKKVVINLFYYIINKKLSNHKFLELNLNKLQGLSLKLSKYFKKPVQLDLTQLYSVSHNSQILVQILGKLGLSRRNSFSRIIGRFLKYQSNKILFRSNQNIYSKWTTILTGVNIHLGGRLMRGKIIPRRTVKKIQYGSLARSKANYISTARLTQKNKRGSFSFTVSMGHKFF
uniref:ribosomal protein S3 n=1 Tax=Lenzites betulinus TaxID=5632 RepID=UPI00300234BC|nr:ribosomal protein S3 [Lenzites betulinus]